jgi:hypothetical protein
MRWGRFGNRPYLQAADFFVSFVGFVPCVSKSGGMARAKCGKKLQEWGEFTGKKLQEWVAKCGKKL